VIASSFAIFSVAGSAAAQQSPTAAEDIIVSARKTDERLQDVPISVNALNTEELQARGAVDFRDILRSIPGVAFAGLDRGLNLYNIRGISTSAAAPTVGLYLDDIALTTLFTGFSGAFDPVLFDMERVEVLKGPQGTLYGGSSMGGAIKYVSARPKLNDFGFDTGVNIGGTKGGEASFGAEAVLNIPVITDRLSVRGGIFFQRDGGYIDNVSGGTVTNTRASSTPSPVYTPVELPSFSTRDATNTNRRETYVLRLSALYEGENGFSLLPALFYQNDSLANPSDVFRDRPPYTTAYRIAQPTDEEAGIYSLTAAKKFDFATLTSLTAYFDRKLDWFRDYSFINGTFVPPLYPLTGTNLSASRTKTFSQEVRLASNPDSDSPLTWLVGLFYSHQDDRIVQTALSLGATPILGGDLVFRGDTRTVTRQYAAFGEAAYSIVPGLDITAGVRLFRIKQTVDSLGDGPVNGGPTAILDRRSNESGINPKFGISYKITDENLVFASAAKGFRPGGPNRFTIDPVLCRPDLDALGISDAPETFGSDNLWSYELGSKNRFADGKVTVNGALFLSKWKKIQQSIALNSCGFSFTGNFGEAEVKGAELEVATTPFDGFTIGGNATYTDARITQEVPSTPAQEGDSIIGTPDWMASAFAQYELPITDAWSASFRLDYFYQGGIRQQFERTQFVTFSDGVVGPIPNPAEFRGSYDLVNAAITVANGPTRVRFFVNNLLDNNAFLDEPASFGVFSGTPLRPRTYGVQVRYSY
jgi:outer membrane receptor protein involved in Fe transport